MVDQAAGDRDRSGVSAEAGVADERFEELLAESSLGSPGARALRERVSDDQAARLRRRVAAADVDERRTAAVDEVMGRERRQATEALLADWALNPFDRKILVLAMNGWTFAAMAKILEVTIPTVHRRYRRIYKLASRVGDGELLLPPPRRQSRPVKPDAKR